jgi:hypothetical protein
VWSTEEVITLRQYCMIPCLSKNERIEKLSSDVTEGCVPLTTKEVKIHYYLRSYE